MLLHISSLTDSFLHGIFTGLGIVICIGIIGAVILIYERIQEGKK